MTAVTADPAVLRRVGSAAAVKIIVMAVTGVLGLLTSRLIIQNFGIDAYAQYGLLASLPSLLPFADLGLAAVIINAIAEADDPRTDAGARRTIVSAVRLLLVAAAVIVAVAMLLTILGAWPVLLGSGLMPGGDIVAGICLALFGVSLPLTIGPRLLVGLGRNTAQIAVQVITAPLIFTMIALCVVFGVPAGGYLAVATYVASVVVTAMALGLAARVLSPQIGDVVREVPRIRSAPGVRVLDMAWPMLIQMLALPVAMQTGRILVSHLGGVAALAEYNLGYQIFGIALQTISAAGVALWPIYARARAQRRIETPWRPTLWFLLGGLAVAAVMAVVSPWLSFVVSGGAVTLTPLMTTVFVCFVALQAAKYPIGMYMTDLRGLRFQVVPALAMVPIALIGSWFLVPVFGGAGNVLAVSVAVALCQVVPNLLYVRRDLARRRGAREPEPS